MLFRQRCSPKEKTKCEKKLTSRTSGHKPSDRRARRASSDSWLISHSPPFSPLHSNAHEPCHSPFPRQRWHEREKRGWERKREEESGRERERAGERWSEGARERRRDRDVDWERERRGGGKGGRGSGTEENLADSTDIICHAEAMVELARHVGSARPCVCVGACVCAFVCVCVCACVCGCVMCVSV